jgi:hypothetical protein
MTEGANITAESSIRNEGKCKAAALAAASAALLLGRPETQQNTTDFPDF